MIGKEMPQLQPALYLETGFDQDDEFGAGGDSVTQLTPGQIFREMPEGFRPERAGRANAVIQFHISGRDGGDWYVTIKDRTCVVSEGIATKPDATVQMDATDYIDLATGKLKRMQAFASRKIKASGDLALLQRMDRWFVQPG
jgi:putative sterol carrier protein